MSDKPRMNPFKVVAGNPAGCQVTHYYGDWTDARECYEQLVGDILNKKPYTNYTKIELFEFDPKVQPLRWVKLMSYGL